MLRAGGHRRAIESLIKTHNNCMLMTDRVRFKKSGPLVKTGSSGNGNAWSAYKVRGSSSSSFPGHHRAVPAAIAGEGSSGYQALEALSPKNIDRLMAIFGWRRIGSGEQILPAGMAASRATLDGGLYSVKLQPSAVLRSGYSSAAAAADGLKPLMLLAPASEAAAAGEEVGEK